MKKTQILVSLTSTFCVMLVFCSCVTWQNSERVQRRHLPVRFDEIDASSYSLNSSSSGVTCQEPKPSGLSGDESVSKPSPYPTPITLTDDVQTSGTVFPSFLHNKEIGKNPRIRSQYVYPVLKPVEKATQLKKLVEESFGSDDYSAQLEEQLEKGANKISKEMNLNVDTSLSSWLPPKQSNQVGKNRSFIGKTPGDRPILGMVAAHWNNDETVSSPPKWWDGNGIPNSTNKYKEVNFLFIYFYLICIFVIKTNNERLHICICFWLCRIRKLVGTLHHLRKD